MQFSRVGLGSIRPPSQKLWPNQILARRPHCNYNKRSRWPKLPPWEGTDLEQKQKQFCNDSGKENNLETCQIRFSPFLIRIALLHILEKRPSKSFTSKQTKLSDSYEPDERKTLIGVWQSYQKCVKGRRGVLSCPFQVLSFTAYSWGPPSPSSSYHYHYHY